MDEKNGAFRVESPCIKSRDSPQRLLKPFGYWNGFSGFNQTVTAQLEKVDGGQKEGKLD